MTAAEKKLRAVKRAIARHRSSDSRLAELTDRILDSESFLRVVAAPSSDTKSLCTLPAALLFHAMQVRHGYSDSVSLRLQEKENDKFNDDLAATIRFLTRHVDAHDGPGAVVKDATVRKLIKELKALYGDAPDAPTPRVMGQKYNHRAYAIRSVALLVPTDTQTRAATIAKLMQFAGYPKVDRRLVTSILRESARR